MISSLQSHLHPLICKFAQEIHNTWQATLDLSPYSLPEELGYVEGQLEGERLTIENYCYQTPQFRKIHLELAQVGDHLDILHCVMFPRPNYELPLFGTDVVRGVKGVSAAIVDLSPVNQDRSLPQSYVSVLTTLPNLHFSHPRELPPWGDIFSDWCLFIRPVDPEEEQRFCDRAITLLKLHCQNAQTLSPTTPEKEAIIRETQRHYCLQQQKNGKTRGILQKAFGSVWAERYMTTMLFDAG